MAERNETIEKDIKGWLLGFEKHIGVPVVISLTIENQSIKFLSCYDRKELLNELDKDPDEEEPGKDIKQKQKELQVRLSKIDFDTYLG